MKTADLIDLINYYSYNNDAYLLSLDEVSDLLTEYEGVYIDTPEYERDNLKHYIKSTDIYRCEDGYVGITGVKEVIDIDVSLDDISFECEAREYVLVNGVFKRKKK